MDPITLIVTAVTLGAAAGLKDAATQTVKDAYTALKALLSRRKIDVTGVERKPDSESKQDSLREDLRDLSDTPDEVDDPLLDAARHLIAAVTTHDPAAADAVGIDLEELQAASLRISGVTAESTGVRGKKWTIAGDAVFENIHAGHTSTGPPTSDDIGSGGGHPS